MTIPKPGPLLPHAQGDCRRAAGDYRSLNGGLEERWYPRAHPMRNSSKLPHQQQPPVLARRSCWRLTSHYVEVFSSLNKVRTYMKIFSTLFYSFYSRPQIIHKYIRYPTTSVQREAISRGFESASNIPGESDYRLFHKVFSLRLYGRPWWYPSDRLWSHRNRSRETSISTPPPQVLRFKRSCHLWPPGKDSCFRRYCERKVRFTRFVTWKLRTSSFHDARVLRESEVWRYEENARRHGYYFLADKAYAYLPWCLPPYKVFFNFFEIWVVNEYYRASIGTIKRSDSTSIIREAGWLWNV